jgi:formylglycine-generating enzyme required for sulfatase activity
MLGNVREWTTTLWGEKRREPDPRFCYPWAADEREDLQARRHIYRVYRGGAAADKMTQLRCSARNGYLPDKPGPPHKRHGFRVVLSI